MVKIKVGFIGTGKWAQVLAKKFIEQGCEIVAHDRRSDEPADPVFGPRVSWRDMIARNSDLRVVVITAGPDVNEGMVRFANDHGVAVFVSKPFLPRQPIVQRIPIYVDLVHQFSPAYARLHEDCVQNKMRQIHIEMCGNGPVREFSSLYDYGPHAFGILCDLARNRSIAVKTAKVFTEGYYANHVISGKLDGTIPFSIVVGNKGPGTRRLVEVTFDDGVSSYQEKGVMGEYIRVRLLKDAEEERIVRFRNHDPLSREVRHFLDYVRSRTFTDSPHLRISFRTATLLDEVLGLETGQGV